MTYPRTLERAGFTYRRGFSFSRSLKLKPYSIPLSGPHWLYSARSVVELTAGFGFPPRGQAEKVVALPHWKKKKRGREKKNRVGCPSACWFPSPVLVGPSVSADSTRSNMVSSSFFAQFIFKRQYKPHWMHLEANTGDIRSENRKETIWTCEANTQPYSLVFG